MSGSSDDGREHSSGCVVSGETGLAHSGSIVHNQGSYFFVVTHFEIVSVGLDLLTKEKEVKEQVAI